MWHYPVRVRQSTWQKLHLHDEDPPLEQSSRDVPRASVCHVFSPSGALSDANQLNVGIGQKTGFYESKMFSTVLRLLLKELRGEGLPCLLAIL